MSFPGALTIERLPPISPFYQNDTPTCAEFEACGTEFLRFEIRTKISPMYLLKIIP